MRNVTCHVESLAAELTSKLFELYFINLSECRGVETVVVLMVLALVVVVILFVDILGVDGAAVLWLVECASSVVGYRDGGAADTKRVETDELWSWCQSGIHGNK